MYESKARSIVKALSWRFFATIITSLVVWFMTHRFEFALAVGLLDTTIKLFSYFIHERIWQKIRFGMLNTNKRPEYEI